MRVLIIILNVVLDGFDQSRDIVKGATANSLLGEIGEPAFDKVQPRTRSRSEVQLEARMPLQPGSDAWMFMRTVVVDDDV